MILDDVWEGDSVAADARLYTALLGLLDGTPLPPEVDDPYAVGS